jgi:hypothetical protein
MMKAMKLEREKKMKIRSELQYEEDTEQRTLSRGLQNVT